MKHRFYTKMLVIGLHIILFGVNMEMYIFQTIKLVVAVFAVEKK